MNIMSNNITPSPSLKELSHFSSPKTIFILICGVLTVIIGSYGLAHLFPTRVFLDGAISPLYLQIGVLFVGGIIFSGGYYLFKKFPRDFAREFQTSTSKSYQFK